MWEVLQPAGNMTTPTQQCATLGKSGTRYIASHITWAREYRQVIVHVISLYSLSGLL